MAQQVKVLVTQSWKREFNPWNPHKGENGLHKVDL